MDSILIIVGVIVGFAVILKILEAFADWQADLNEASKKRDRERELERERKKINKEKQNLISAVKGAPQMTEILESFHTVLDAMAEKFIALNTGNWEQEYLSHRFSISVYNTLIGVDGVKIYSFVDESIGRYYEVSSEQIEGIRYFLEDEVELYMKKYQNEFKTQNNHDGTFSLLKKNPGYIKKQKFGS